MTKICSANCSKNCLNEKKCKLFRCNYKNYNVCNNVECNVFVCKACSIEMNKHRFNHCIVNCTNNINNTELDIESLQENYENCNSCNFCNLCTFCNFSRINDREHNLEEDDDLIVRKRYFTCCICNIKNIVYPENYNSLRESYLFNRLLDYTKQLGTLLGIILVPIFLTCIVLLIQTKGTIVNEQIPNSLNDIVLLLGIFWCMGMLIILLTCFVINCITCKLRCN